MSYYQVLGTWLLVGLGFMLSSCTKHTVQVEAPDKPITINLNVKIDHEIQVKVEKELDEVFAENSELF
ncbi:MAG: YnbE family lipoprotein [Nitrospira sp. SB0677_bin_15]|nr:YnbE family lipoprotein [Nitrospira sp. SB0667_bin_9]MYD31818.1 YnbE family lipoprotein [Nitrospira sp. SB0661_bin_20]MYG40389.1 YnbE family lipoprotein [Nitrospira sp. SB0677_bin_15]MYJ23936.1 YnbE family lipoprotein [Nitrospira sp. SB0673_bin_12]